MNFQGPWEYSFILPMILSGALPKYKRNFVAFTTFSKTPQSSAFPNKPECECINTQQKASSGQK